MKAWIARDSRGKVYIFPNKPTKGNAWWIGGAIFLWKDDYIQEGVNPQWSDEEPTEVELKIERRRNYENN